MDSVKPSAAFCCNGLNLATIEMSLDGNSFFLGIHPF